MIDEIAFMFAFNNGPLFIWLHCVMDFYLFLKSEPFQYCCPFVLLCYLHHPLQTGSEFSYVCVNMYLYQCHFLIWLHLVSNVNLDFFSYFFHGLGHMPQNYCMVTVRICLMPTTRWREIHDRWDVANCRVPWMRMPIMFFCKQRWTEVQLRTIFSQYHDGPTQQETSKRYG